MRKTCSCVAEPVKEITDSFTARISCPICSRYILLLKNDDGKWETAEEKMKRIRVVKICVRCFRKFSTFSARDATTRDHCERCRLYF